MSTTGALRTIWSNSASTLCGALPRGFRGVIGLQVVDVGVFEVLVSAVIVRNKPNRALLTCIR
jgi:hypothetical protein